MSDLPIEPGNPTINGKNSGDGKPTEQAKNPLEDIIRAGGGAVAVAAWKSAHQLLRTYWKSAIAATVSVTLGGAATIYAGVQPKPAAETWFGVSRELRNSECRPQPASAKEIDVVLADDKKYGFFHDVWELQLSDGPFRGRLRSVEEPKKTPAEVSGFFAKGDFLVGAMKGVKGRGVYFLQTDPTQEYYYGWQTALDCEVAVNVVCPYVLGPEALIGRLQQELTFISKGRCRREAAN